MTNLAWLNPWTRQQSTPVPLKRSILGTITTTWFLIQTVLLATPVGANNAVKTNNPNELTYSELLQSIDKKQIESLEIDRLQNRVKVKLKGSKEAKYALIFKDDQELIKRLNTNKIDFEMKDSNDNSLIIGIFFNLLLIFLLLTGLGIIIRRSAQISGQAMNFGKSRARFQMEANTGINFQDVAGIDEAKEELQEIVTFLKQPEKFTAIGAKIPKGVLLIGPPGTGKTLLAKAIAGEAGVPFFSISGWEFVEMFVGVGASRVRDLFKNAKETAPCLIFIDEIDAVGRQRGVGIGGGNDEREQTLNQMLTEMDGFENNTGIIVIAATNRPDVLDNALLRPGRFDRQVMVDYPDVQGRHSILSVHSRNKKLAEDVSLQAIARRTPGFTGADLANLLNEAAILTARRRKDAITINEINDAVDRVVAGMEGTPLLDSKAKRLTAYHEIGHALTATLLENHYPVEKVTLIPRGQAKGLTWYTPDEEQGFETRAQLLDRIVSILGGRAAEEVVFGTEEVTAGASDDIQKLTNLARQMVTRLGMSELGLVALEGQSTPIYTNSEPNDGKDYSEEIASEIDRQIRLIIQSCYQVSRDLLLENRELMDYLVDILIDQETIEGADFRTLVEQYKSAKSEKIPTFS